MGRKLFGKKERWSKSKFKVLSGNKTIEQIRSRAQIKDPFGNVLFLKRALTGVLGLATYRRFNIVNKMKVEGAEYLQELPKNNVLFISNHQTYYADVIALYHVFSSAKWGQKNIDSPIYLLSPKVKTYYIAAEETMKNSGLLPKLFSYAGAVTVRRAWRSQGKDVKRNSDVRAPAKIKKALEFGWVVTFPQGTTDPTAPVRKGTATMIKTFKPIVVPVEIDGFDQAFHKKGLKFRKKGVELKVKFNEPVTFGEEATVEEIQAFLAAAVVKK